MIQLGLCEHPVNTFSWQRAPNATLRSRQHRGFLNLFPMVQILGTPIIRLFLASRHLPPTPQTTLPLYPMSTPAPPLQGGGFGACSPSSLLGRHVSQSFPCCKPRRLSILFAGRQANGPGSVPAGSPIGKIIVQLTRMAPSSA